MEDYATYLAEEAKSDIVALHQFRILYDPRQETFHFFFEGEEDSLFYMPEARRIIAGKEVHIYDCGGKGNVVEVRDSIKSDGYLLDGCLFFIDRDYDDYLGTQAALDQYTYLTDSYSVENELTSAEAARVLLMDVLRVSRADPEFARIENYIETGLRKFHVEVRSLVSWILAASEEGCKPNLRNTTGLKDIVYFVGGDPKVTKDGFKEFKKKVSSNGKLPSVSGMLKWRRILDLSSSGRWVRGKYELWFFQVILLRALEETNSRRKAAGGRAISVPSSLKSGKLFEVLGGRIKPPLSLQAFYAARLA
ncbi:DUF4435 domain-containing protein [Pseudomonas sp. A2]|uniref:DUF4435 domain-containing protein n=1 Tax=Pseudomonas sp. A2 TaxID=107445 RepID=UPI001FFE82AD|nr:DUF4435 domain-containing protein [Pseudomonas sp. A2]UPK87452.1 DUF4435 domain-containing protein [Pseudomonas sp. A2]